MNMCKTAAIFVLLFPVGCTNSDMSAVDVDSEISFWMGQGWENPQVLGDPESKALIVAHVSSATALRLTAVWIENGQRSEKIFDQEERVYLILTFSKFGGDSFVVVLEKGKKYGEGT